MQKMLFPMVVGLCLALACGLSAAEKVSVTGYGFSPPDGWKSSPPSSSMRKAQFTAGDAEVVFFYFGPGGGGGVQANVDR